MGATQLLGRKVGEDAWLSPWSAKCPVKRSYGSLTLG
jgi:hypothetical protein